MMMRNASMFAGVLLTVAGTAHAQASPPPTTASRDTQPALIKPRTVSAPPPTVAPRLRAAARPTRADSAPVEPMRRVGAPPDSVRPTVMQAPRGDTARNSRTAPPPPARPAASVVAPAASSPALAETPPPTGATARCKDGTYLFGPLATDPCAAHGGLAALFPERTAPPPAPRRP